MIRREYKIKKTVPLAALATLAVSGLFAIRAQQAPESQFPVPHPECVFFQNKHDAYVAAGQKARTGSASAAQSFVYSDLTAQVAAQLPSFIPGDSRTGTLQSIGQQGVVDRYLFQAMADAGVTPADPTNDYEFIRRATLDLTGRIPTPDRVLSFAADTTPNKRAKLVDELVAKPEWVDKWTMYFGDLFKNNSANTQIRRYDSGVQAFNAYIRASLSANKPYDQIARELISTQGTNSYAPDQGQINWAVGGVVTGGPIQDIWDQQTANVAETFLGISHVNCLLCHNGRGHLDALSLWGSNTTRYQAWGLASFLSHTQTNRIEVTPGTGNPYYWSVDDKLTKDYPLNTTSGNRPARQPTGAQMSIPPLYLFGGQTPAPGQNYRISLAQNVTSDFQFARAAVNYIWAQFFEIGLVDPPNQFDVARLDPDNPPPGPWLLQPSNPRLLNALAQAFIDNRYDLKWLMRQIANSMAYQLSARYSGTWNPAWQNLFARKMVRRLWSEEIHDAVAQSSGIVPTYNVASYGPYSWAMQLPEPLGTPDGITGKVASFLDAFLRGNRDDEERRPDGSISQALDLMNDPFVMSRIASSGPGASNGLLARNLNLPDDQLVNTLFLTVLSRYPTDAEKSAALANLKSNRSQEAENLLWSLYNKVDFTFNY